VKTAWKWKCSWLAAALLVTGCAKFDLRKNIPWGEGKDGRIGQPMRVEAAWVDTVLSKPDEKPMRGFGGRLYFFGPNNSQESVKVDGTLVIYAFNETNRDPSNVVPDRKIVYQAKEFERLYTKSKLGHSYSVWVPWDEAGGPQSHISLIARFIPAKGSVITSEQVRLLLPGIAPLVDVRNVNNSEFSPTSVSRDVPTGQGAAGDVQQVSYQQPAGGETSAGAGGTEKPREIETYTIPLRGSQAHHFIKNSTMSGGARVTTLTPSAPWNGFNGTYGAYPNVIPQSSMVQPLPLPQAQAPQTTNPTTSQTQAQQPARAPLSAAVQPQPGQPWQLQTPNSRTIPWQLSAHSGPWRHPARASQAVQPSFGRDRWGQYPTAPQHAHSSSPSPATSPQLPGYSPGAGQPLSQLQTDYAAAY
jgi:hypothetical protein